MTTITVLGGAGLMGSGVIRDLISDRAICDITSIRVCDMDADVIGRFIAELSDSRLVSHPLNVKDSIQLKVALDGADLCINSVPTLAGLQMTIFEAALDAHVPYIDLGGLGVYTVKQKEWHERFVVAGVTAVLSTGADPGMSNVLCRAVANELDSIDKINLYWAATVVGPENPVLIPPYSVSTVLAEYAYPSTQFFDGKHIECEPMTGIEFLELPEPWGRTEFMYSPHSEQLTVPLAKGIKEKGIQEFTWKLHLPHREHEAWIGLVKAGFGDFDDPVEINGVQVKPLDVLNATINRNIERNTDKIPDQEGHEIHLAIGRGKKGGVETEVHCEVRVHPDPMYTPYVDAATSMNVSIAAQLLLNTDPMPGVWAPEEFFEINSYFEELRRRNFNVAIKIVSLEDKIRPFALTDNKK